MGESLYSRVIECYLYKVHGVCIWVVFSIIIAKNEGNNMKENMDCDYKINDYQKCKWEVSSQLPFLLEPSLKGPKDNWQINHVNRLANLYK